MKLDGNYRGTYRTETWERVSSGDGIRVLSDFTVDDEEQVTLTYELWAETLRRLGFKKVEKP